MQSNTDCIRYTIDRQDCLSSVDDNWDRFAVENQAGEIAAKLVLHKPLFDFIADAETKEIYRILLERVRVSSESIRFTFRCDAPDRRRYMEMRISSDTDGSVHFHSCLLRQESRESMLVSTRQPEHTDKILNICSWCKQIQQGENEWVEVEDVVTSLGLFEDRGLPRFSHGVCPDCKQSLLESLK